MNHIVDPSSARREGRESATRSVAGIFRSTPFHWVGDGFHVSSYFPRPSLAAERVSPFVLMDYGPPHEFTPLARGKRGVGWHPHRGFETVTVAWEGSVAHRDSTGQSGIIGPGDVQWMTAGAGILHDKMARPGYQPITAKDIPVVTLAGGAGKVRVIAGEHEGTRGPARTFTPITLLDVTLQASGRLVVTLPPTHNAMAIVTSGRVDTGGRSAAVGELILFENDGAHIDLAASEDAHVLVLGGEPLNEPIVQYGPFVMNTRDDIRQAIVDFEAGAFGDVPAD